MAEGGELLASELAVDYGGVPALRDVSLHVPAGQFLLVTGPSGCGKSTLARALAGLIPHAIAAGMSGRVWIDGLDTQALGRESAAPLAELARHVGIVLQNPSSQLFHLSVGEEVAFGPRNLGLPDEQVQGRVDWALAATGLQALRQRRPGDLSGGEQQRVAIAAVLAMQPAVLILDEPTASLDTQGTRMVFSTLRSLNRRLGMTIVLVEHRLDAAMPFAHRLLVMDQGQIVADGAPQELLRDQALRRRYGLRRPAESTSRDWKELLASGLSVSESHGYGEARQPLVRLEGVAAGYGRKPVVQHVDLELYSGEFAALVGENGVGKSTLAQVMAGLLRPSAGRVQFLRAASSRPPSWRPPSKRPSRPRPGRDVSLLFQNPVDQLFSDTVDEELAFGPQNYGQFDQQFHEQLLQQADLHHLRGRSPAQLSVGQQQRCILAACLALQPPLLILDEPTLGQDWAHLQQLMDFVQELNRRGTAILLISHDYKLVYRYARRVLLMERGRIVLDGYPQPQSATTHWEGV